MLTYSPHSDHHLPKPTEKPWLLLLLCFIWLWPGIFGHDPWKPDEPYVLAVVETMLDTGNWVVPMIGDTPYLEAPPLYYWVAATFGYWLAPDWLSLPDAARLATPFFMALGLTFAGGAGRELVGRRHGRSVVMILIGCVGLIATGHQLNTAVAAFAGFAAAFYALALTLRAPGLAGALLALATVALFLSSSLLEVALVWMVALVLPAFRAWRSNRYLITLGIALGLSIPVSLFWPWMLGRAAPAVLTEWWQVRALGPINGFGRIGLFHDFGYYGLVSLWYTWPAWPLAAWTLYRNRRLQRPLLQLPLMFFAVVIVLLTLSDRQSSEYALPLLLPLAVLGAVELDTLRRGAASFLNWFGLMAFGLFGLLIWAGWAAMNFGWPERLARRAAYFSPYYQPEVSLLAAGCALVATAAWVWAVTRRHLRGRQAVTNWAAGMTLCWGLALTLWLPWLDAAKSYRPVVERMMAVLPREAECVATESNNQIARISWAYYGDLVLRPFAREEAVPCDFRLVVRNRAQGLAEPGWTLLWEGARPREKNELFGLLQRTSG
ncbi:ArnT family glycosyltransferase [Gulbenkiania mobilis]|uniref:4-amino-4-deoxy-L-arabinose transferase-like glycosyltransferase n=1 Tax=Gulbenkiania mobilis TaxID=397457 RepID=A0ABY2D5N6_GULMO|nr:4-amino-4-deoxy-L-arabinose transferase-like glycosyltransferase [Gulbenkiania mobilis]